MADSRNYSVQVNLPKNLPEDIKPTINVFDTHGRFVTSAQVPKTGSTRLRIPARLKGAALRFVVAPIAEKQPSLKQLRRVRAMERMLPYDPAEQLVIDIGEAVVQGWILCVCTVRGRVVKAVPQPTGTSIDYPICNARVHICEVDKIPRIIFRIPDEIIYRVRDELLKFPFPPDPIGPAIRKGVPGLPTPPGPGPDPVDRSRISVIPIPIPAPESADFRSTRGTVRSELRMVSGQSRAAFTNLARAANPVEMRNALVEVAAWHPWWCWFDWLDPFFRYEVDCLWSVWTDSNGEFSHTFVYPCSDTPDLYLWVEQFIAGSWVTIYARGPRCDTHWNYACGTEITIHVTHPDAIVCVPPPEIEVPPGITTWVLPMAVGELEIAGGSAHPADPVGWVQSDGTASYAGGPAGVEPIDDAPLGGYLRFKMLHSLDLPKAGLTRYSWSYRPKPSPDPTVSGGWTVMDETVTRKYQIPGPGGFPRYPVYTLGPDEDGLFQFRPHSPPAGVWPVSGFSEDMWSAKLDTTSMPPGLYQIRVTVHDATGAVVAPSATSFQFVATDTRDAAKETYDTRAAAGTELIDDGFVFDVLVDNAHCVSVLHPVQTASGAIADPCGFLRYADKASTAVTLSFEASHPRDHGWFTLEVVRGMTNLDQVEVMRGGLVGSLSVPVDSNGVSTWPNAFYTGDGAGNFVGNFSAARLLESCDNGAFGANLWVRAKAYNGHRRLHEYDRHDLMAFALAEEPEAP